VRAGHCQGATRIPARRITSLPRPVSSPAARLDGGRMLHTAGREHDSRHKHRTGNRLAVHLPGPRHTL
jgi:hypothetical protein